MAGHPARFRWPRGGYLLSCLLLTVTCVAGQENAGMTIPSSLLDCYGNATLLSRAGLPTFGIGQLFEIIRKVENWQYTRLDLKNMAVQLTHRFRLDGVKRDPRTLASDGVIPFTPAGPEFFRHQILLMKLIPGNAYNFPNESLSIPEQCALHFMMSTTVDDVARGDEDTVCSQLKNYETDGYGSYGSGSSYSGGGYSGGGYSGGYGSGGYGGGYGSGVNYNSRRQNPPTRGPRKVRDANPGIESDVEILDPDLQAEVSKTRASMSNYPHSRCPVQGGAVFTPWGAVNGGTVIAGIAAGLVPQSVPGEMLAAAFPRSKYYTARRNPGLSADTYGSIDNKWAATFSGDLAQVALLQGVSMQQNMQVGIAGGWNSTLEPRHYFLNNPTEGAMSDANIRGCIDGLLMGSYVSQWYSSTSNSLRLSQLLDMFYSERGVFDRNMRACVRRERFSDVVSTDALDAQTETFSRFYARNNPITVTMSDQVISSLSSMAVNKLQTYIPSSLNDPPCTSGMADMLVRPYVDITLLLDTTLQYMTVHPAIAFLLDKVEAGRYGSNVMVLNAKDGSILFNSSYPRVDWHLHYTREKHETAPQGFDTMMSLASSMQRLRDADYERQQRRVLAGRGQVLLLMPMQGLGSMDQAQFYERLTGFRQLLPDVEMLVLTQGNKNAFSAITNDTNRDVFVLNPSDPATSILPLVERIKTVPRRVRNPNCNSDWIETSTGNSEFVDYVEPMGVNTYRIIPNNFFRTRDEFAKVRLQSQSASTLTVCYSRNPMALNSTRNTQTSSVGNCTQVTSNGIEILVRDLCNDAWLVKDCPPVYVSVAAGQPSSMGMRCAEDACRFPDMLKYTLIAERLGCWSGAAGLRGATAGGLALLLWAWRWWL